MSWCHDVCKAHFCLSYNFCFHFIHREWKWKKKSFFWLNTAKKKLCVCVSLVNGSERAEQWKNPSRIIIFISCLRGFALHTYDKFTFCGCMYTLLKSLKCRWQKKILWGWKNFIQQLVVCANLYFFQAIYECHHHHVNV